MTDIRLDTNGDIDLIGNVVSLTDSGAESTAQRLKIKLKAFEGEWAYDTEFGIDYFGLVFVKSSGKALVDAEFRSNIIDTPGVAQLAKFSSTADPFQRVYDLDFTVIDQTGETIDLAFNQ